jgi:hypothetical protein
VPDKERYPGPLGWGLSVGLISSPLKNSIVPNPSNRGGHGPKKKPKHCRRIRIRRRRRRRVYLLVKVQVESVN